MSGRVLAIAAGFAAVSIGSTARAQEEAPPTPSAPEPSVPAPMPVAFGADDVRFDLRERALQVTGHVHVDEPPFHLTSEKLQLKRVPIGVELEGRGQVAFCPCLGTPLAVRFEDATIAPPHDLVLRSPVLEVFGVPVAWAPVFWLRSPGRVGLLPPDVQWRGNDGLLLGEGVHVPLSSGDMVRGVDLRAAGYVQGGVAVSGKLRTAATETRLSWDQLHADGGIGVGAHGAADAAAWQVDALRGRRAVVSTTDVEAAARPFDRAEGSANLRADGWTVSSGVRTAALRGGDLLDLGVGGPIVSARRADAIGSIGAYDATVEGGALSGYGLDATTYARTEGGVLLASRAGPAGASLALRGVGDVADDGVRSGLDGAGQARAALSLPLARSYGTGDETDRWLHETTPRVEAAALATHTSGVLVVPAARGMVLPDGEAWIAEAGWHNGIGRAGARASAEIDVAGGAVGDGRATLPVLRARAAGSGRWLGLRGDFARIADEQHLPAGALVVRARLGPASSLNLDVHAAERDGIDPVIARALTDAPLEPASGFLASPGWTGGARLAVPIGPRVTTRGGADYDFASQQLVAVVGALELHDPCGCLVVRATLAHRIGRDGVDAWVSIDLPR